MDAEEEGREPETGVLGRLAPAQAQSMPTPDAGKIFSKRNRVGMKYAEPAAGHLVMLSRELNIPGKPGKPVRIYATQRASRGGYAGGFPVTRTTGFL